MSEESRKKMSVSQKGHIPWNKGMPRIEETRNKISETLKNKVVSDEEKQKRSEIARSRVLSDESKKSKVEKLKGNKNALGCVRSDEAKKKMSESKKGKPTWLKGKSHSDEAKKKISDANKGNESTKGTIWINNGSERKMVKQENLNEFIAQGFKLGKKLN